MRTSSLVGIAICAAALSCSEPAGLRLETEQITFGPKHHIFGYIGHVQNIPWNASGRYILALQFESQDRLPGPDDPADVVLLDAESGYAVRVVDQSRGWNPQQGTMFYWNPEAAEKQFFFNDRDTETGKVFCVLYDIEEGKRVKEYRYEDTPFGNGGVAQNGGYFLGINYARMARLRPVTGYAGAYDWTGDEKHPDNDGIFKVNVATGEKQLLVSFREMRDALVEKHPNVDAHALFINHTLWNREDDRIYFYVRGGWTGNSGGVERVNVPMTVNADGTGLIEQSIFVGGHPEWEFGHRLIGAADDRLVIYDTDTQKIVEQIGTPEIFPEPGGDTALSPDGKWIVNGYKQDNQNYYVVYRRSDGAWARSRGFDITGYTSGPLRNDASPKWRRDSRQVLFPGLTDDAARTRQMFVMTIHQGSE